MFKRRSDESTNSSGRRNIINLVNGRFFGFAAILIIALGLVGVPLQQLVTQNFQISQLQSQLANYTKVISELRLEREQWEDPAFVKAQVRERMAYVMPDEVGYIVLDSTEVPAAVNYRLGTPIPPKPWFATVLDSLETAGMTAGVEDLNE
jgi:cell division protein FtsB